MAEEAMNSIEAKKEATHKTKIARQHTRDKRASWTFKIG